MLIFERKKMLAQALAALDGMVAAATEQNTRYAKALAAHEETIAMLKQSLGQTEHWRKLYVAATQEKAEKEKAAQVIADLERDTLPVTNGWKN